MKHFFLNLLSSRYYRSWGPGEAKSSSSVCYSAEPQPQTKLKKAIQVDTKLNANNIAEMHLMVYLGQSNLEQNGQSLWRLLRSKLITEEKHMQVKSLKMYNMLSAAQEVCFQNSTADTECGEWWEVKESTDSIY